jgi:hypothetical protein
MLDNEGRVGQARDLSTSTHTKSSSNLHRPGNLAKSEDAIVNAQKARHSTERPLVIPSLAGTEPWGIIT